MDALRASIAFANPLDAYSANSAINTRTSKKSNTSEYSLRSSPASSPSTSPKAVATAANIAPPSPAHSSGASSCSSRSRLRVATPDSHTPGAGAGGGEMSVSGGSQLGAALDMKTTGSAVASVAAVTAAAAVELLHAGAPTSQMQSQKIKKLVRRNASDKLRLIQMVHDNPILWDSRLPNFKGAEEEKNRAWEMIGKEFNAPGRRVARAFKSLRESYRRELAHVKLMGNGFKPKWSLYEAMDFLRDVIRERKGGSHAAEQAAIGLNLSAFSQHLNNNNNNKSTLKLNALHSSFNESALNLSKCAPGLNMSHEDYYYYVKSEMDLSAAHAGSNGIGGGGNAAVPIHPLPAHQTQQQQQQLHSAAHDSRVSSTRNDSTTQHSNTFDDLDASSVRSGDEASMRNVDISNQGSDEVEELEAIDADFPYPLILDANSPPSMSAAGGNGNIGGNAVGGSSALKRKRRDLNNDGMDDGAADDEDDYEGQMMQQHRHLRQQNGGMGGGSGGGMNGCMLDMPPPQTVREVLNSKFCGFISAKLNSMEDTEADNLMNKILMLLVQTQTSEAK
ncbi:PREDICTED: uncharacterized protein LOC108975955 isoform X2 [Bactrocera latifrons]|uniref:MADF domain-containing protein n=1 Tax=Bactrocera latifrons TaxID=174628 RepID=A0A0K8UKP5_BACLA|nr:PREDICTED: uncharacterized protein LOC108975955 isoform X2 [Bactrocera latifrons]